MVISYNKGDSNQDKLNCSGFTSVGGQSVRLHVLWPLPYFLHQCLCPGHSCHSYQDAVPVRLHPCLFFDISAVDSIDNPVLSLNLQYPHASGRNWNPVVNHGNKLIRAVYLILVLAT